VEHNKENKKAYLRRGKAYEKLDDTEKALRDMKSVLALDPQDKEVTCSVLPRSIELTNRSRASFSSSRFPLDRLYRLPCA
jgi:tetratricopeptide (TPR) repeat protein